MGMFPGGAPMMMPGGAMPAMPQAAAPAAPAPAAPAEEEAPKEEAKPKEEKKKETVTIKLVGFETAKKIQVVKEVRAITALGLKESKDLVESAPKVLKKSVPIAQAEAMRDKLVSVGAEVSLD